MDSHLEQVATYCRRFRHLTRVEASAELLHLLQTIGLDVGGILTMIVTNATELSPDVKVQLVCDMLTASLDCDFAVASLMQSNQLAAVISGVSSLPHTKSMSLLFEIAIKALTSSSQEGDKKQGDTEPLRSPLILDDAISMITQEAVSKIDSEDLSLSDTACRLTEIILSSRDTARYLPLLLECSSRHQDDSTIHMRYVSVISRVLGSGNEQFEICRSLGAADMITGLCRSNDDILVQILALNFISSFANSESGFEFLINSGFMRWMITCVCGSEAEGIAPDPLLGSESLRVLGEILVKASLTTSQEGGHSMFEKYLAGPGSDYRLIKDFLRAVLVNIDASDEARRLSGVRALFDFAASSAVALELVVRDEMILQTWISLLNGKPDLQAATLHSIANVIASPTVSKVGLQSQHPDVDSPPPPPSISLASTNLDPSNSSQEFQEDARVSELKKILCYSIGKSKKMTTSAYLLKTVRMPIDSLRAGALDLMRAIALQPSGWGVYDLYNTTGFREYLEDPETEFTKEGKEWKFSLVQALATKKDFVGDSNKTALEKILARGPFYKPVRSGDVQVMEK